MKRKELIGTFMTILNCSDPPLRVKIFERKNKRTLTCIAYFSFNSRRFLIQFSTDFDEFQQGLFSSQAATTVKFSSKNII